MKLRILSTIIVLAVAFVSMSTPALAAGGDFGVANCPFDTGGNDPITGLPYTPEQIEENAACVTCVTDGSTWTALGCIDTSPEGVFTYLVRLALGVLGGLILIRMIYLGYLYQTGDEGKIAEARKGILSAIGAILVVVFSVVGLQFIGVNILDVVPTGFFGS